YAVAGVPYYVEVEEDGVYRTCEPAKNRGRSNRNEHVAERRGASTATPSSQLNVTPGPFQLVAQDAEKRDFRQESKLQTDLCPPDGNAGVPGHSRRFATIHAQETRIVCDPRRNLDNG